MRSTARILIFCFPRYLGLTDGNGGYDLHGDVEGDSKIGFRWRAGNGHFIHIIEMRAKNVTSREIARPPIREWLDDDLRRRMLRDCGALPSSDSEGECNAVWRGGRRRLPDGPAFVGGPSE